MRFLFSSMKLHFISSRFRTYFISSGANDSRGLLYLRAINPVLKPNILNFKRYEHTINVQKQFEDNAEQKYADESEFVSITHGDPVIEKKLKILFLEAEVSRQNGGRVPDRISLEQWKELLEMPTRSKRRKYMSYIFGIEKKKESKKQKKNELKQLKQQRKESDLFSKENEDGQVMYGLGQNSIFLRIYDATITKFHNSRLIQAMLFGQKLVLDCSYDSYMSKHEAQNCAKQMMLMFSDNRFHDNPFDLHFCNIDKSSVAIKQFAKYIPTLYEPEFPLNITEKSYLDIFPKENLVYLTPHCREVMKEFDHDAVYIIGAMVDKANSEPLSLAKAKREGLKMAKLPLDEYLLWGSGGSKSLTLNQMISILLEVRQTGDWNKALLHVPRRKVETQPSTNDFQKKGFDRKQRVKQRLYNFKIEFN